MKEKLNDRRKIKFQEVIKQQFVGCLFDIDGTLTVRGEEKIPVFLQKQLAEMITRVPMGVCTARKFDQALERVAPIFEHAATPLLQKNWIMICENGCLGYAFDPQKNKYEEFYRVPWPYDAKHFEKLFLYLQKLLADKLQICFTCEVSMIFRPVRVDDKDREALARRSRELANIVQRELPDADPLGALKIGDSGIGITIFPKNGNKEHGIIKFAEFLREKRGCEIGAEAREIVVVGDQPIPPGNDAIFLNGEYGTPFTVGETNPENILPLPVFDSNGNVVKGPQGTSEIINKLIFKTNL